MRIDEYQALAARTLGSADTQYLTIGLAGEVGELCNLVKKAMRHGMELTPERLHDELGDILWYLAMLAQVQGLALDDIAQGNIQKLVARYPEGFCKRGGAPDAG
jgi:NTP pyrophosphatase (non-canonical NTP hydrolase)